MATKKVINRRQFLGRTRLNFGMTADGTKLMIYNAGFQIELYDAKTLELVKTIDLEGDTTSNLVVMPLPGKSVSAPLSMAAIRCPVPLIN